MWSLAWNPMGHMLATGGGDHCVRFWCRARPGDAWRDKTRSDQESAGQTGELQLYLLLWNSWSTLDCYTKFELDTRLVSCSLFALVELSVHLGLPYKFEFGVMVWLLGDSQGNQSSSGEMHVGWCRERGGSPAKLCSVERGHTRHRRCGAAAPARFPARCDCPGQQLHYLAMDGKRSRKEPCRGLHSPSYGEKEPLVCRSCLRRPSQAATSSIAGATDDPPSTAICCTVAAQQQATSSTAIQVRPHQRTLSVPHRKARLHQA